MLETGRICWVCNKKLYKKDFEGESYVCHSCTEKASKDDFDEQLELKSLYMTKDATTGLCGCGRYFRTQKTSKGGKTAKYTECNRCRALGKEMKKGTFGSTEHGDRKSLSPDEKKNVEFVTNLPKGKNDRPSLEKRNGPKILNGEKKKKSDNVATTITTKRNTPKDELSGGKKTVNDKTPTIVETTENPINATKSESADIVTIPQLDSNEILNAVNEENFRSINSLKDSTSQLIGYAKRIARPLTVAEDNGEIIRDTSVERMMDAAKCLEMARNTMKTQLEYLKFAKSMTKKELS